MKKLVLLLLLFSVFLMAAGCGQGNTASAGFSEEDLFLDFDGTSYGLNIDIETVISGLGTQYEYSEAISCDYDGLDKTYRYEIAEFYTYPLPEGDLVCEIYTESPEILTSKGIRTGDAKEAVLTAYGSDCEDTGYQLVYKLPGSPETTDGGSLCFDIEDGVVKSIYITTRAL